MHTNVQGDAAQQDDAGSQRDDRPRARTDVPVAEAEPGSAKSLDNIEVFATPELRMTLKPVSLFVLIALLCAAIGAFTAIAYKGVVMKHVYDAVGSSKVAEDIVEKYNTTSGFIMALVEVLVGLHMEKFMPVFEVYIHNMLWFLTQSTSHFPVSHRAHTVLLFIFPVLVMLMVGNSLRGLQASHSTVGFESIMLAEDLGRELGAIELLRLMDDSEKNATNTTVIEVGGVTSKLAAVTDTILANAVLERTTAFYFTPDSPCVQDDDTTLGRGTRTVQLSADSLDATSVTYGFATREWNSEALATELKANETYTFRYKDILAKNASVVAPPESKFSMKTAFEMFFQGQTMIEKAIGDSQNQNHSCSESDYLTEFDHVTQRRRLQQRRRRLTALANTAPGNATSTSNSTTTNSNATTSTTSASTSTTSNSNSDADDYFYDDSYGTWTIGEDGVRVCEGPASSLVDLMDYMLGNKSQTLENFMRAITASLDKSFPGILDLNATEVALENYEINPQIHVQALRIDVLFKEDIKYGLTPEEAACSGTTAGCPDNIAEIGNTSVYLFDYLSNAFCGSDGCAFLDNSDTFHLQKEVGMIPYTINCSDVQYSGDFRGFYPTGCDRTANASFAYGIGSYITGDEFGFKDTTYKSELPYIIRPRRHIRFSFAKMMWTFEDLADRFDATCDEKSTNGNCEGLWHQLQPSRRFLFAGHDAIPTSRIAHASFQAPIPLVQLNAPSLYIEEWETSVELERLNPKYFTRSMWNATKNESLSGDSCSMLMDSYMYQIADNNYFLERPLPTVYTSAFYYLMANAGVTELNDTKAIVNATLSGNATDAAAATLAITDALGYTKLKGDQQLRTIRVLIPKKSFIASFSGLMLLVALMLVVLGFPKRRVEYFADGTSKAQEYIAIATDKTYPSAVYWKSFVFPASGESVPLQDYRVEAMTLAHSENGSRLVQLP